MRHFPMLLLVCLLAASANAQKADEDLVPLFNNKDLSG